MSKLPFQRKRLVIVDWASLSYHKLFAMGARTNSAFFDMTTPEAEMLVWKNMMIRAIAEIVEMLNPMDIVFAIEGKGCWRNAVVKEYYDLHAKIAWNKLGYYVRHDNILKLIKKTESGEIEVEKLDPRVDVPGLNWKSISECPEKVREIAWDNVLPKYKGTRHKADWPFLMDRRKWRTDKDEQAKIFAPVFRAIPLCVDDAEGDDAVVAAVDLLSPSYESTVIVSLDGDMVQLLDRPNVYIWDHKNSKYASIANPKDALEAKILMGDKGDNIMGVAIPGERNHVGEAGAKKMVKSGKNLFESAQVEGWADCYQRNRRLIDMRLVPKSVMDALKMALDVPASGPLDEMEMLDLGLPEKTVAILENMRTQGHYVLLTRDYVIQHPEVFTEKNLVDEEIAAISRTFDDYSDIFDPTKDGNF